eukprot:TRINITY_DN2616_c0_g1_i1.p1 TRINITY_DN2616_c0_g1~~TRINITY_DN2616_c0_g1_i1.p1  ORF type:complete len:1096 (-),score=246.67 TRINITY_DN2616_c0_g1_i1:668-3955(-)
MEDLLEDMEATRSTWSSPTVSTPSTVGRSSAGPSPPPRIASPLSVSQLDDTFLLSPSPVPSTQRSRGARVVQSNGEQLERRLRRFRLSSSSFGLPLELASLLYSRNLGSKVLKEWKRVAHDRAESKLRYRSLRFRLRRSERKFTSQIGKRALHQYFLQWKRLYRLKKLFHLSSVERRVFDRWKHFMQRERRKASNRSLCRFWCQRKQFSRFFSLWKKKLDQQIAMRAAFNAWHNLVEFHNVQAIEFQQLHDARYAESLWRRWKSEANLRLKMQLAHLMHDGSLVRTCYIKWMETVRATKSKFRTAANYAMLETLRRAWKVWEIKVKTGVKRRNAVIAAKRELGLKQMRRKFLWWKEQTRHANLFKTLSSQVNMKLMERLMRKWVRTHRLTKGFDVCFARRKRVMLVRYFQFWKKELENHALAIEVSFHLQSVRRKLLFAKWRRLTLEKLWETQSMSAATQIYEIGLLSNSLKNWKKWHHRRVIIGRCDDIFRKKIARKRTDDTFSKWYHLAWNQMAVRYAEQHYDEKLSQMAMSKWMHVAQQRRRFSSIVLRVMKLYNLQNVLGLAWRRWRIGFIASVMRRRVLDSSLSRLVSSSFHQWHQLARKKQLIQGDVIAFTTSMNRKRLSRGFVAWRHAFALRLDALKCMHSMSLDIVHAAVSRIRNRDKVTSSPHIAPFWLRKSKPFRIASESFSLWHAFAQTRKAEREIVEMFNRKTLVHPAFQKWRKDASGKVFYLGLAEVADSVCTVITKRRTFRIWKQKFVRHQRFSVFSEELGWYLGTNLQKWMFSRWVFLVRQKLTLEIQFHRWNQMRDVKVLRKHMWAWLNCSLDKKLRRFTDSKRERRANQKVRLATLMRRHFSRWKSQFAMRFRVHHIFERTRMRNMRRAFIGWRAFLRWARNRNNVIQTRKDELVRELKDSLPKHMAANAHWRMAIMRKILRAFRAYLMEKDVFAARQHDRLLSWRCWKHWRLIVTQKRLYSKELEAIEASSKPRTPRVFTPRRGHVTPMEMSVEKMLHTPSYFHSSSRGEKGVPRDKQTVRTLDEEKEKPWMGSSRLDTRKPIIHVFIIYQCNLCTFLHDSCRAWIHICAFLSPQYT